MHKLKYMNKLIKKMLKTKLYSIKTLNWLKSFFNIKFWNFYLSILQNKIKIVDRSLQGYPFSAHISTKNSWSHSCDSLFAIFFFPDFCFGREIVVAGLPPHDQWGGSALLYGNSCSIKNLYLQSSSCISIQ